MFDTQNKLNVTLWWKQIKFRYIHIHITLLRKPLPTKIYFFIYLTTGARNPRPKYPSKQQVLVFLNLKLTESVSWLDNWLDKLPVAQAPSFVEIWSFEDISSAIVLDVRTEEPGNLAFMEPDLYCRRHFPEFLKAPVAEKTFSFKSLRTWLRISWLNYICLPCRSCLSWSWRRCASGQPPCSCTLRPAIRT